MQGVRGLRLASQALRFKSLEKRLCEQTALYELLSKLLVSPLIMENQMEKKMENEMETAIYRVM